MKQKIIASSIGFVAGLLSIAAALFAPLASFASTYGYVNIMGNMLTVSATNASDALVLAAGIAPHSGVMLLDNNPPLMNLFMSGTASLNSPNSGLAYSTANNTTAGIYGMTNGTTYTANGITYTANGTTYNANGTYQTYANPNGTVTFQGVQTTPYPSPGMFVYPSPTFSPTVSPTISPTPFPTSTPFPPLYSTPFPTPTF